MTTWHPELELHAQAARMVAIVAIPSTFDAVARFIQQLLNLLSANAIQPCDQFAIQLAVEEALANAIKHGNQMDQHKQVFLQMAISPSEFCIQVCDQGHGFDPATVPDPTEPEYLERPTGRGLCLIRHYMHEIHFNAQGNAVTLVRHWSPAVT